MSEKMDMHDLARVNQLWGKVYPYLGDQVLGYYAKDWGDVLEWGPFSGGISFALQSKNPNLKIKIAVEEEDVYRLMQKMLKDGGYGDKIHLDKSRLIPLVYGDQAFDLVIIRGAYFFLDQEGAALREVYRVMKPGGVGFIGGGYGKNTPQTTIDGIADESRLLNDRLGRIRVTVDMLREMVRKSGLSDHVKVVSEGGLWLLLEK